MTMLAIKESFILRGAALASATAAVDPSTSYGISYRSQRSTFFYPFFAVCFSQDLTPLDQHSHDSPVDCIQEASKFQIQHKILVTEW